MENDGDADDLAVALRDIPAALQSIHCEEQQLAERRLLHDRLYDAGCQGLAKGLPILPINGKRPCNKSGHPMRKWQTVACDAKRLSRGLDGAFSPKWYRTTGAIPASEPGIGLRMGPNSCIDIEADSDDERDAVAHLFRGIDEPKTVSFTSRRGRHDLYRYDDRLTALGKDVFTYVTPAGKSVKVRIGGQKSGAQSVIPPSQGRNYLPGRSFDHIEPAPLPDMVIDRLLEQSRCALTASIGCGRPSQSPRAKAGRRSPPQRASTARPSAPIADPHRHSAFVLRASYESLHCAEVAACVRNAFSQEVPTCFQRRHESLFAVVRRLRTIPALNVIRAPWLASEEGRAWLRPYLWDWYQAGNRFFNGDYDECEYDLIEGWDKVRKPKGDTMAALFERSKSVQLPAVVIKALGVYDSESTRVLVRLCITLQKAAGSRPFPLDGRACAAATKIPQKTVSRKLRTLVRLGIVKRTFAGRRGRSAEYVYQPACAPAEPHSAA